MKIAIRNIRLVYDSHPLNGQIINLLSSNGKIESVGAELSDADQIIDGTGLCVSVGWTDLRATCGEPGMEYREDFESLAAAAARGGFTEVGVLPASQHPAQTRADVGYVLKRSQELPVRFLPIAGLTVDGAGNDLTEILDLHQAGAVAFSDGLKTTSRADVVARALEYMQPFGGVVFQRPLHKDFSATGVMHEGLASTRLGLRGIPDMAEELIVQRDLQVLKYTGGRIHFSLISTRGAVEQIKEARRNGLNVTCDVAAHQLFFTDETLEPFDSNYKVTPPFRSESDVFALCKGLQEGTIDAVVSDHQPLDTEAKELEFDLADFGVTSLETAFAAIRTSTAGNVPLDVLIKRLTDGPRKVLGLPKFTLENGAETRLTLFDPDKEWVFKEEETESKSRNSPFYGKTLRGKVFGTVLGSTFTPNRFW